MPPRRRPRTPTAWDLGPRIRALIAVGALIGLAMGILHPIDAWPLLLLAPAALILDYTWATWARARHHRRRAQWDRDHPNR